MQSAAGDLVQVRLLGAEGLTISVVAIGPTVGVSSILECPAVVHMADIEVRSTDLVHWHFVMTVVMRMGEMPVARSPD